MSGELSELVVQGFRVRLGNVLCFLDFGDADDCLDRFRGGDPDEAQGGHMVEFAQFL